MVNINFISQLYITVHHPIPDESLFNTLPLLSVLGNCHPSHSAHFPIFCIKSSTILELILSIFQHNQRDPHIAIHSVHNCCYVRFARIDVFLRQKFHSRECTKSIITELCIIYVWNKLHRHCSDVKFDTF